MLEQLTVSNAVPPNESRVRFSSWSAPYGEEEYLRGQGVPVEAEANRRIQELERPVKEFANKHLNSTPTQEEVSSILPSLQELYDGLSRTDVDGVHIRQRDYAWGYLTAACARIARVDGLSGKEATGSWVKTVLLEGSHQPNPTPDPKDDAQFDEGPSWGGPAARIEAAEGLIVLARNPSLATSEVMEALERLSKDHVPAVRYQIARHFNSLYKTAPEFMWRFMDQMSRAD